MTESSEHVTLVQKLGVAMRERWPTVLVTEDLPRVRRWRHTVGKHVPDVVAWTPTNGRLHAVGEAKPHWDLWSRRFRNQLLDWLSDESIRICLITSEGYAPELQTVVEVVVGNKAHSRVLIIEDEIWWSRRPGTVNWISE